MADTDESSKQIEKTPQKTPEAAAVSGVIGGQKNQEIHAAANDISHANDRSLSEPEMIAIGANETVDQYNVGGLIKTLIYGDESLGVED